MQMSTLEKMTGALKIMINNSRHYRYASSINGTGAFGLKKLDKEVCLCVDILDYVYSAAMRLYIMHEGVKRSKLFIKAGGSCSRGPYSMVDDLPCARQFVRPIRALLPRARD